MAWEEWEQLKTAAAERHSTQMQLNQLPADQAGPTSGSEGSGTLRHSGGPWTRAAGTAEDLQTSTGKSKADLSTAHDGVVSAGEGLASLGALMSVLASWKKRLGHVRNECDALEPKLRQVAKDMGEVDARVGAKAEAVTVAGTGKGE